MTTRPGLTEERFHLQWDETSDVVVSDLKALFDASHAVDLAGSRITPDVLRAIATLGTEDHHVVLHDSFVLPGDLSHATFRSRLDLSDCVFLANDTRSARRAGLGRRALLGASDETSFRHAKFEGSVEMRRVRFCGTGLFEDAEFASGLTCAEAVFEDAAIFERATVHGDADFSAVLFHGGTRVPGTGITDDITKGSRTRFHTALFFGSAVFDKSIFSEGAVFDGVEFHSGASFREVEFKSEAWFSRATFKHGVGWYMANFNGGCWFEESTVESEMRFSYSSFSYELGLWDASGDGSFVLSEANFDRLRRIVTGPVPLDILRTTFRSAVAIDFNVPHPDRKTSRQGEPVLHGALERPSLSKVEDCVILAPIVVGAELHLTETSFAGTNGLENLRFLGDPVWSVCDGRRSLFERDERRLEDAEREQLNRQMRDALESSKARTAASDFFFGEMKARQRLAWRSGRRTEGTLLWLFRLMSGYGLRISNALGTFVLILAAGTLGFWAEGLDLNPASGVSRATMAETVLFTLRSMVGFFNPPDADLAQVEQWLQLVLRFLGPVALTQIVLAVREKVAR